jgi:hypothetical protein
MSTPCYYCEMQKPQACKVCVHGDADVGDLQRDAEDAKRYRRLVESGDFVPSILGGWAIRVLTEERATKEELDAAVDGDIAQKENG